MGVVTASDRQVSLETVTCNDDQALFVIPSGGGYSCWGYENCQRESRGLAEALGRPDLSPGDELYGTLVGYDRYSELLKLASKADLKGTYYEAGTPDGVKRALESLIGRDIRVTVTHGDPETGRAWGDKPETGTIGRTGGTLKSPILVKTRRSSGGGLLSPRSIVRLESEGRTLYRHPEFHLAPALPAPDEVPALPAP